MCETMSFHVTTRVTSMSEITTSAAPVASIHDPPAIHRASAITTSNASVTSRAETGPIRASSAVAHAGTASPDVTCGG